MPDADRRAAILVAAKALFTDLGFNATSLGAIIARSQTSKGTLYHYFTSKEDLYTTVLEEMMEHMWRVSYTENALATATHETFWRVVAQSWRRSMVYMVQHPGELQLWRDFQDHWRSIGDAGPAQRLRARSLKMGESLAVLGQRLGCVRLDLTPTQCAELVDAMDMVTDTWFFNAVSEVGVEAAFKRHGALTLEMVWRMLSPKEALTEGPLWLVDL